MSLLYRTGTGRNNIAWGGSTSTAATYLRRTSTGRNDISYINISSNGTYNILNRTSTGRNNIRWNNLTFSFFDLRNYAIVDLSKLIQSRYGQANYCTSTREYGCFDISVSKNQYTFNSWLPVTTGGTSNRLNVIYNSENIRDQVYNMIKNNITSITLTTIYQDKYTISMSSLTNMSAPGNLTTSTETNPRVYGISMSIPSSGIYGSDIQSITFS